MAKVVPIDNILFASEMLGAVKGIDPETGHHYDDTKRYIDQVKALGETDRYKIFEGNARRVYPRLDRLLAKRGHVVCEAPSRSHIGSQKETA
jgi:4-oxalmesaconate hydratase